MSKHKLKYCRIWIIVLISTNVVFGIYGCSSTNQNTSDISKPPQRLNQTSQMDNPPPINTNTAQNSSNIESHTNTESYVPFTKVEEIRSTGGTVTQIKVNNRGDLPSYYIYPEQQQNQNLNINNQQKNIATPTWQFSW